MRNPTGDPRSEDFPITKQNFRYLFQYRRLTVVKVDVLALPKPDADPADLALPTITPPAAGASPADALPVQKAAAIRDLVRGTADGLTVVVGGEGSAWTVSVDADTAHACGDLLLVLTYTVQ